jgi:hypothetical protein
MTFEEFSQSIQKGEGPDESLPPALQSLWWDAAGDWERAHEICQSHQSRPVAWVHGYLHRKEGDLSNAGYWYGRAGKARHEGTVAEEWERLAKALIREINAA